MTTEQYETELSATQAKLMELEQKMAQMDQTPDAGPGASARESLEAFRRCVERNQSQ